MNNSERGEVEPGGRELVPSRPDKGGAPWGVQRSAASLLLDSAQGRAVSPNRSFPFSVPTEYQALRFPVTWSNSSLSVPMDSTSLNSQGYFPGVDF